MATRLQIKQKWTFWAILQADMVIVNSTTCYIPLFLCSNLLFMYIILCIKRWYSVVTIMDSVVTIMSTGHYRLLPGAVDMTG